MPQIAMQAIAGAYIKCHTMPARNTDEQTRSYPRNFVIQLLAPALNPGALLGVVCNPLI